MQENSPVSTPCENAAARVQYWLGKDRDNLLQVKQLPLKSQEFCKTHKCDLVKPPRIPSQIKHLPLQGYVLSKKKRQTKQRSVTKENHSSQKLIFPMDLSHCTVSQKNWGHLHRRNPLSPARVVQCRLKEHFLVSKRLKTLSKQKLPGPKRHQVVPIKSSSKQEPEHNPYLQEWEKRKEERHFRMDRVIKYLTD